MFILFRYVLLFAIVIMSTLSVTAQFLMPDNTYVGVDKQYWVDSIEGSGSTYTWKIDHVIQQSGPINMFSFTWKSVGSYLLEVQETSAGNCPGEVQSGWINVHSTPILEIICPTIEVSCAIELIPAYVDLKSFLSAGGIVSDNCTLDSASFRLLSEEITTPGYPASYSITREYTISDICGNSNKCSQIISIPAELKIIATPNHLNCSDNLTGEIGITITGGTPLYTFAWNNGETSQNITGLAAGSYMVTITDEKGCMAATSVTITAENSLPIAAFSVGFPELMTYSFIDASTNVTTYAWNFGDSQTSTLANSTNTYAQTGTYTVTLIVSNNCGTDKATQLVDIVIPDQEFYNGISPNKDGLNDYWNIPILNYYPINKVMIINRWGSEVWKCINYSNTNNFWNGKNMNGNDLPDGTYYYIINYSNVEKRGWIFIKR